MKVNLLDISEEGHEFLFQWHDEKTIDEKVEGVIEHLEGFRYRIFIQKTGDIYTAQGDFTLQQTQECSLCAEDINVPLKQRFTEYFMNENKGHQKGHAPHSGLNVESEQEVTFVTGHELDLAEHIAETLALAVPSYPQCADTVACQKRQEENKKYFYEPQGQGHPAFSVLSKLKKE